VSTQRVVRDRLAEHQFELPEELRDAKVTDILSNPNFEKKEKLKKNTSGIQLMNQRHQEERQAAAAGTDGDDGRDRDVARKAGIPKPQQRESSSNNLLRAGADNAIANRGVRRTGSNVALAHPDSRDQPATTPVLSVAGSGMGSRNTSSHGLAMNNPGQRPTSLTRGNTGGGVSPVTPDSATGVQGNRVRGAGQRRVPSDKVNPVLFAPTL
jgi:hypothetical protein